MFDHESTTIPPPFHCKRAGHSAGVECKWNGIPLGASEWNAGKAYKASPFHLAGQFHRSTRLPRLRLALDTVGHEVNCCQATP